MTSNSNIKKYRSPKKSATITKKCASKNTTKLPWISFSGLTNFSNVLPIDKTSDIIESSNTLRNNVSINMQDDKNIEALVPSPFIYDSGNQCMAPYSHTCEIPETKYSGCAYENTANESTANDNTADDLLAKQEIPEDSSNNTIVANNENCETNDRHGRKRKIPSFFSDFFHILKAPRRQQSSCNTPKLQSETPDENRKLNKSSNTKDNIAESSDKCDTKGSLTFSKHLCTNPAHQPVTNESHSSHGFIKTDDTSIIQNDNGETDVTSSSLNGRSDLTCDSNDSITLCNDNQNTLHNAVDNKSKLCTLSVANATKNFRLPVVIMCRCKNESIKAMSNLALKNDGSCVKLPLTTGKTKVYNSPNNVLLSQSAISLSPQSNLKRLQKSSPSVQHTQEHDAARSYQIKTNEKDTDKLNNNDKKFSVLNASQKIKNFGKLNRNKLLPKQSKSTAWISDPDLVSKSTDPNFVSKSTNSSYLLDSGETMLFDASFEAVKGNVEELSSHAVVNKDNKRSYSSKPILCKVVPASRKHTVKDAEMFSSESNNLSACQVSQEIQVDMRQKKKMPFKQLKRREPWLPEVVENCVNDFMKKTASGGTNSCNISLNDKVDVGTQTSEVFLYALSYMLDNI